MKNKTPHRKQIVEKAYHLLCDFGALLFPLGCSSCGKSLYKGETSICTYCLFRLPKTYFHLTPDNPVAKMFWGRVSIRAATSYYTFNKGGKVQRLIHQLKYKGQTDVGLKLGNMYGHELLKNLDFSSVDIIVPVPLHKKRLKERGYNQSTYFAIGLAETMRLPTNVDVLFRKYESETQTKKSRFTRWKNVEQLFEMKNEEAIAYKHILLVDDVVTTGATLEACAQALLKVVGVQVSVATIAYAAN